MKPIVKFSIPILIVLAALLACHREKTDFIGPAYISAPTGFRVTSFTGTPTTIDFTVAPAHVIFNAAFTNAVSWTLTIKGQQSNAVHEVKGISNGFSNMAWTGKHDGVTFFRKGEQAIATLSFFGTTTTASVTINVVEVPDYTTCGTFPLYGDFETLSGVIPPSGAGNWASFNWPTPIPNVQQGIDSMAVDYTGKIVPSVQGRKYYYIKGLGNQAQFVSGLQYILTAYTGFTPPLPADPDRVWVNMYIYGTGDANTQVDLEYQEADGDGTAPNYQGQDDDAFVAHVTLDHKGWKLFSFQYSTLVPSANADFGGSGNKIHEPNTIRSFDLVLLKKSNANSPVEVYFDYPIITVDGPFKPCK